MTQLNTTEKQLISTLIDNKLSALDIMDAFWLSQYLPAITIENDKQSESTKPLEISKSKQPEASKLKQPEASNLKQPNTSEPKITKELSKKQIKDKLRPTPVKDTLEPNVEKGEKSLQLKPNQNPIRIPYPSFISDSLLLERAIKQFKNNRITQTSKQLDEAKTAEYYAENNALLIPIYKKQVHPYIELYIVIDTSVSMEVWYRFIIETVNYFALSGVFADVKKCYLSADGKNISLRQEKAKNSISLSPKELLKKRSHKHSKLILIYTDFISNGWRSGKILSEYILKHWHLKSLVSIINVLPKYLWDSTPLAYAENIKLFTSSLYPVNNKLSIPIEYQDDEEANNNSELLKIPLINSKPESLVTLSNLTLGTGKPINAIRIEVHTKESKQNKVLSKKQLTAQERVDNFYQFASGILTRKLATYIACIPMDYINLPIIKTIQIQKLPEAGLQHIAEFFLSGLVKQVPTKKETEDYLYKFYPDVKKYLVSGLGGFEQKQITGTVLYYINQHYGNLRSFLAYYGINSDKGKKSPASNDSNNPDIAIKQAGDTVAINTEKKRVSNGDNTFPFTNRKKELELILTSKIKDQLITAPMGYGKKTFLEKLEKEFNKEGYVTFLKEITDQNSVVSDNDLCRHFGFKNSADFIKQKLTKEIETKIKDKGLVFLFITSNFIAPNLKLLKGSVKTLRDQIKNKLQAVDPNYQHHGNKLRLIVSSRQLYGDTDWPYGYEHVWLSEFTDQVILDSLKENDFFSGRSKEEYTSIVARLTLLTAGHPAIVKSSAENFKVHNYFDINQIKNDINLLSLDFSASIKNAKVKGLFGNKKIPLYRYIDDTLLANIAGKSSIKREEIFASLLSHGIYEKAKINGTPSKVIKDRLLRRTCAIDYCYQQANEFLRSAKIAKDFYYKQFDNGQCSLDFMILWLVESWFNDLQKKLLSFSWSEHEYNDKVGDINTKLFQEIPKHIETLLNHIKADNSKPEEGEKRLLVRLEHDWEFKLLLGYLPYKPDTQCYSTDTYNDLISLVKVTFAKQQGVNHVDESYNDELDDFIGREKELKQLTNAVNRINSQSKLVFINGEGGVGKTVLIRKFKEKIKNKGKDKNKSKFISIDFDFDDNAFHKPENLRLGIALQLARQDKISFSDYLIQHQEVIDARKSGAREGTDYIKGLHQQATESWLKTIEETENQFIFYFDTLDKLSKVQIDRIARYFFSQIPKNTLIIISGRDKAIELLKEKIKENDPIFYTNHILSIDLNPLIPAELNDFTNKKIKRHNYSSINDLPIKNPIKFINFIKRASHGLPILIDLSLEAFASPNTVQLEKYQNDIDDLINNKKIDKSQLHYEFKRLLIHHYLENYSGNLRLLVLVLAHAWPLGKQAIEEILDLDEEMAGTLMNEARQAIYIKRISNNLHNTKTDINQSAYFLNLHDVMREMINEYAWAEYDPKVELRQKVSKNFLFLLENIIKKGEKRKEEIKQGKTDNELIASGDQLLFYNLEALIQRLRIQKARHTTCLSIEDGLSIYITILKEGKTENKSTHSQYIDELNIQIEDILKTFHKTDIYNLLLNDSEKIQLKSVDYLIEKLNFLTSRGRLDESEKIIEKLETLKESLPFNIKINLFREIATTYLKNGELNKGLTLLKELEEECKEQATKEAYILLFPVYVQMGWANRLLGNTKEADKNYSDADGLLLEQDLLPGIDIALFEVAALYQTWAYTKALLGHSREAKDFINIASSKFKEIGFDLGEGYIQSVMGRIQIEFDDYEDAIVCFEKAHEIFSDDNLEWQSKVSIGLAIAHLLLAEYKKDNFSEAEIKQHLNLACSYLEEVEKWKIPADQPEALYISANLYYQQKDYKKADEYFKKAWDESKKQNSLYYLYRSLIGQMRIAIICKLQGNTCQSSNDFKDRHKALILAHNGINDDKLVEAIFYKTLGDLYFLEGDHDKALELYKEYLPKIAEHGRFYAISLKGQLDRTESMFLSYVTNASGEVDAKKEAEVHALAHKLWDFWKDKKYTRKYPAGNPLIRSWISGIIHEWNHAPRDSDNNKKKKEVGEE